MPNTLTVTDNRTGKQFELPIDDNSIKAEDLGQIRVDDDSPGLVSFDPALANTAACRSAVSYIDGERASCGTAAIRSSSLPRNPAISRQPT